MHISLITADATEQLVTADRNHLLYAVAIAAAYAAPLPSMPVDAPASWFEQNVKDTSSKILGVFNEVRTFEFARAVEITKEVWLTRYVMAHGLADGQDLPGIGLKPGVLSLFNAENYLSQTTRCYLEEHFEAIRALQYSCNISARRIRDHFIKASQEA